MKKSFTFWEYVSLLCSLKVIKIMKNILILMVITVLQVFASDSYSQNTRLTLKLNNVTVENVLNTIEDQSEFYFLCNKKLVDVDRKVSVHQENQKIGIILTQVFEGTNVDYVLIDRQIVLAPDKYLSKVKSKLQPITITGTVRDENGETLPGVSIKLKGTVIGTVTNLDGEYVIDIDDPSATLVFSFIGHKTQEIAVGNNTLIDMVLEADVIGLEEVVVTGYGTMRKSDLTGSVTRANIAQMEELPNVSVIQAMQGTVAGLNIGAVDQAGENPTISIRGQNTLPVTTENTAALNAAATTAANAPLIVVDGSIYRGSLVDLNTADIESIDILKDASSAAIYGSQASNGVMLITTKKGTMFSKPVINYVGSYTVQVPSNKLEPMNSAELTEFFPDIYWTESRLAPDYLQPDNSFSISDKLKTLAITEGFANGQDTDWWGSLTGNGYINAHNLSVRGKNENLGYFVSGGMTDVKGFVINDTYKKYNYRINVDTKINDWMNVGIESFLTSSDYSGVSPSVSTAFFMQPWAPIYDDSGEIILTPEGLSLNPFLTIEQDDSDRRLNMFANIHADIKLPIKGLAYRINFSQNYRTTNQDRFNPWGANYTGTGYKYSYINYDWTLDNILTYKKTFSDVHHVNATLLYGVEERDFSYTEAGAENFVNDLLGYNKLEAGDPTLRTTNTGKEQESSSYSMARIFYNYDNKYLMTGTVRRDGFSGFGTEDKIGVFPSIALAWVVSEEGFISNSLDWLNYMKIRASYGQTGRRGVGRYDTRAIVDTHPSIIFGDGGSATQGQWISSMANNQLGWETTTGLNFGVDFAILNSRLHGNIEYYNNNTENILYAIQLPTMTGFETINTNIGEVANHGIEFTLNGQIINSGDLKWAASVYFSRNRNEIVSILGDDNDGDGIEDDLVADRLFIGEPQQVIYDYEINGMWQLSDEIPSGFFPGTYKIADLNGDGVYSGSDDMKILGYRAPSYRLGIANTITYKQFSLYIFINAIQGGSDYYYGSDTPFVYKKDQLSYQNVPKGAWDYWMPENTDAYFRRLDTPSNYAPDRYAQRNFIRLQDVSLSYTFDKGILQKLNIGSLKIFVSGKNLATITKWRGWDPETGLGFSPGRPLMANYTFGVNVEF